MLGQKVSIASQADTGRALASLSRQVGAAGPVPYAQRALFAITAALVIAVPLPGLRATAASDATEPGPRAAARFLPNEVQDPDHPKADRFTDTDAGVTIVPPPGWVRSPATALNPESDPPEPVQEIARFQVRIGDPQLYASPIPVTSGLVADATAVISIGVARVGSDLLDIDRGARGTREVGSVPGFTTLEDEATYEGLHVLTRYLFSRETDRVLVVRAAAAESAWSDYTEVLHASLELAEDVGRVRRFAELRQLRGADEPLREVLDLRVDAVVDEPRPVGRQMLLHEAHDAERTRSNDLDVDIASVHIVDVPLRGFLKILG